MQNRFLIALILTGMLAACSGEKDASVETPDKPKMAEMQAAETPPAKEKEADTGGDAKTETPAETATEENSESGAEEAAGSADLPGHHKALIGTQWQVGEFWAEFQDADTVFIKGKPVEELAPGGAKGSYELDGEVIVVKAMGETRTGTWDGEKLVIDGNVGELLSE